jgi:hypothetical protein
MKDMARKSPNHSHEIINIVGCKPACPVRCAVCYLIRACLPKLPLNEMFSFRRIIKKGGW